VVESTKLQVLHFDDRQGKVPFCDVEACAREYALGFHAGYFCCVEKKLRGRVIGENGRCFRVVFQNMEILVDDMYNFEIERMII
jgi:hypothetical protein